MDSYDYVIVGAGSAGCVLANKLGEDKKYRILVLEAGPMDSNLMIHIPAGVYKAYRNPKINWNYLTEDEQSSLIEKSQCQEVRWLAGHPLSTRWYICAVTHSIMTDGNQSVG